MFSDRDSYNYSIFAILVAWIISSIAHIITPHRGSDRNPAIGLRQLLAMLRYIQDPKDIYQGLHPDDFISRQIVAYRRGYEDIAAFTAAVLAGNLVGLGNGEMNMFAFAYLICHVLYAVFDIIHEFREGTLIYFFRTVFFCCSITTIAVAFIMAGCMMVEQGRGGPSPSVARVQLEGVIKRITTVETCTWIQNLSIICLALSTMANSYGIVWNLHSIRELKSEMKSQQSKFDRVLAAMEARSKENQTDLPGFDHATQQA